MSELPLHGIGSVKVAFIIWRWVPCGYVSSNVCVAQGRARTYRGTSLIRSGLLL